MKKIATLCVFALTCISLFAQRNEVADPSKKNDQEAKVVHITPGSSGVKRGIGYKFLLRRGDEDPGNGLFRFNDDNVSDVRFIYVDNLDITGEDQTKFYSSWDQTTGATGRGRVTIADANGKVISVFYFKGVFVDGKGFWKLPVEYVSGELPIDGHIYYYVFDRIAQNENPASNNQPAPVVPANPVTPVIAVIPDTVVVPVIPVTEVVPVTPVVPVVPVTEVVPVTPVVPVTEVIPVTPVVPVVPVVPVTEVVPVIPVSTVNPDTVISQVKPSLPGRPRIKTDTERPDSLANPVVPVNPSKRTVPVKPIDSDAVGNTAKKNIPAEKPKPVIPVSQPLPVTTEKPVNQAPPVIPEKPVTQTNTVSVEKPVNQPRTERPVTVANQPKPANPVSQPKPANPVSQPKPAVAEKPVIQEKPALPVSQPKPSNPVNQTYPASQGNQSYPVPESNRLPSYQRYTGSSSGISGKWYRGIIEAGYGLGVGDYGISNFRLNFINGFKIGNSSLGLGIGYRRYFTDNNAAPYLVSKKSVVPVFLDFRTTFSDRKLTPYFALGLGGAASSDTTLAARDRLFFTTSGGIWYNVSDRFAVFAGVAYELQKLEFSDTNPYTGNYRKNSNSISLNIGIAF